MAVDELTVPILPATSYNYLSSYDLPQHFQDDPLLSLIAGNFEPDDNQVSNEGATLGRVLFYDKRLSRNNEIACASCHVQAEGFSDHRTKSVGIFDQETSRNSMGFQNLRFNNRMFWDHRVNGLENQVLLPIESPIEMDLPLPELISKLSQTEFYAPLFEDAFGDQEITSERVSAAISQFIRSITSFNSKYDIGIANGFSDFTELENEGKDLFFSGDLKCNQCHSTQNFYSTQAMNNGLDLEYEDQGQFLATGLESDKGEFRVPSLRNVEYTAPYMHDGRFETLDDVLEHYSTGVQQHPNLNDRITVEQETGGTPIHLNLTEQEKDALKAFLKTLSDPVLYSDERFSDPF
ncbi:MAG: cytochrome-c peroxidase [Flavobacteriales bacterium]|nr:cytochrome-c peroxidase [Flavobacteriales bacterium]